MTRDDTKMTQKSEKSLEVGICRDGCISVMVGQCVTVDGFHGVIGRPASALHDIGVRDSRSVQGRYHVVPVVMEPEVFYSMACQEAPMPVRQGIGIYLRDTALPDHLRQLVGQFYVPV